MVGKRENKMVGFHRMHSMLSTYMHLFLVELFYAVKASLQRVSLSYAYARPSCNQFIFLILARFYGFLGKGSLCQLDHGINQYYMCVILSLFIFVISNTVKFSLHSIRRSFDCDYM